MESAANPTPAQVPVRSRERNPKFDVPDETRPALNAPLPLVRRLSEALLDKGVRYCQWKSTESIALAASGEKDLDLLVARQDADRFRGVLDALGFKIAPANSKRSVPGVFHAFGLDRPSGKLVHVHAHFQLVLGDDMTKNFRLPIELPYLASARGPVLMRPSAEFEMAVFVLRMVLKHSTPDAILFGRGALNAGESRELVDLGRRADRQRVLSVIEEHLPYVGADLWSRCARCLEPGASPGLRVVTSIRLERSLAAFRRYPAAADLALKVWRRSTTIAAHRLRHRRSVALQPLSGGLLIAIVGGDGAGKSTVIAELAHWLSADFVVSTVHLGKPPWSLLSSTAQRLWIAAGLSRRSFRLRSGQPADGGRERPPNTMQLVRQTMTSRDRCLASRRAGSHASRGAIVICDRYPFQIPLMDGPAVGPLSVEGSGRRIRAALRGLEDRWYSRVRDPDLLLVLRVPPEVAVERKRGDEPEWFVRERCQQVWQMDWGPLRGVVVDAGRPLEDVVSDVKGIVWSRL